MPTVLPKIVPLTILQILAMPEVLIVQLLALTPQLPAQPVILVAKQAPALTTSLHLVLFAVEAVVIAV